MSASAAVWNGRFGAFGIVSMTLGSLRRWRKVWQKLGVKSNLARRRAWGGSVRGGRERLRHPLARIAALRAAYGARGSQSAARVPPPRTDPPHARLTLYRLSW